MAPLKLLMFGATGPTGLQALKQALDRGHHVTAVARTPEKLKEVQHDNLEVCVGDASDKATFDAAMDGKDAVLSCIGAHASRFSTVSLYSESIRQIHDSMKAHSVSKGVFITSWGLKYSPTQSWFLRTIVFLFIKPVLDDMARMEDYLESSGQDITYTVVRPPGLSNEPITNADILVDEKDYCVPGASERITRADVAKFMLDCLETDKYDKKMVSIGVKPEQK